MGTSNSFNGQGDKTPLIPSWLNPDGNSPGSHNPSLPPDGNGAPDGSSNPSNQRSNQNQIPPAGDAGRFRSSRANFSRFASSGGSDTKSLGRAVSSYISTTSGGTRSASSRIGAARKTSAGLANFLTSVATRGIAETLKDLNLDSLAGRPIEDIFTALIDHLCPDGGNIDEAIAREAFIETIADLSQEGITDLNKISPDQMETVFELYITHAIEARLCNDIGNKIILLPRDARTAVQVQRQLRDFIRRGVADALASIQETVISLRTDQTIAFIDKVYLETFEVLQSLGDAAAEEK